jgi:hypothetical protein
MNQKAIVPYMGAKRLLAAKVIEALGEHRAYWEPFCGSMAVLLNKPVARIVGQQNQWGVIWYATSRGRRPKRSFLGRRIGQAVKALSRPAWQA